jgi:D-glycero-alpha-D-manno-heptose-7-phosphate kinase
VRPSSPATCAEAPCRVDLAGGTLDLWPISQLVEPALTINAALGLTASCRVAPAEGRWTFTAGDGEERISLARLPARPERDLPGPVALAAVVAAHFELPPVTVETSSRVPRGSGLGGSSALAVALVSAMAHVAGQELGDAAAVALACNLETRILRLPGGTQDHWAARCGGVSVLEHAADGTRRVPVPHALPLLESALVLADTGVSHHSGMNNWSVLRAFLDGDPAVGAALDEVAAASADMRRALAPERPRADALAAACRALSREWQARRRLSPAVTCREVEALVAAAEAAGGSAKVCGAGGGGVVACLAPAADRRAALARALEAAGGRILAARLRPGGVRCWPG